MENERLLQFIERIENLNEQIDALRGDVREVFASAKDEGYSAKALREVLKLRKMTKPDRDELAFEVGKYKEMLGM